MSTRRSVLFQMAAAGGLASGPFARAAAPSPQPRKPGVVQTVLGPIEASKLGFVLTHEHIFAASAGMWQYWPEYFGGRAAFIARAVEKLKAVKASGVDTMVDLTTPDLGRDIRLMAEVSQKSGLQIVAATGHWLDPTMSSQARTADELAEFFVKEIERGMEGTDIRAGVIKVATDKDGVTPFIEKALRGAARASKATGTPIETHTLASDKSGEKQAAIFDAEGLSPSMVSIGHCDDSTDMAYLTGLMKRGYTIGMDHLSRGMVSDTDPAEVQPYRWTERVKRIKALVDQGFADRIFLSNDWLFAASNYPTGTMDLLEKLNGDGMCFLTRKVIPYMRQIGISDQAIRLMTVEHPKRFFGGLPA
jgi:phosphotriesterase-related protein